MNIDFNYDEILFLEGETGTVGIVKVAHDNKMLFIATQDNEEIVQFLGAFFFHYHRGITQLFASPSSSNGTCKD